MELLKRTGITCTVLATLATVIISLSSSEVSGLQWEYNDGDSIIIEVSHETDDNLQSLDTNETSHHYRTKRQFPSGFHFPNFQFPAGWPFIQHQQPGAGAGTPGLPSFPSFPQMFPTPPTTTMPTTMPSQMGSCRTKSGLRGRCATFRQCYPFVYSSIEGEEDVFRNPGLAADLRERSGPCETHTMPNYLLFRADIQLRQSMVCCADDGSSSHNTTPMQPQPPKVSNIFHPQITMRPPWAIWSTKAPSVHTTTTTTTTTTQRPQPSTTQSLWPNWPPPFITHPPSHFHPGFPHQIKQTTQAPPVVAPQPQWPPATQPSHRPPPVMTTPAPVIQAPVSSSCGYTKIVGGSQATKAEFPWLVAIMRHGRQICGGSLIDSQWILSAAHCFQDYQANEVRDLRVQIGDYDIYSNSDGPVIIRAVNKLARHRGFSKYLLHNDIALLKLDAPVQFGNNGNNNIQPICLASSGGYEGSTATVAGWGGLYENGPQPAIYRKANLNVWGNQQCAAKYGSHAPGGITSQMVCAGSPNSDACRGDSGGPLMRNTGGRWEQFGIVSWGIGCGRYPGVYTRVDHYADWITRNRQG